MGTIGTGSTPLPTTTHGGGGLSQGATDYLRVNGIPDSAIGVANDIVGGIGSTVSTAQNGGFQTTPTVTTPTPAATTPTAGQSQVDPSLDSPDPNFPGLTQAHVAVFKAMGTPDAVIKAISDSNPNAGTIDQYIQSEIMQNPEGWDAYVGNPAGTARQGLQALLGVQLPAPGQGNPGTVGSYPQVTTPTIGVQTAPTDPNAIAANAQNDMMKWLVWGAVGLGVAFLGYKFLHNRNAAKAAEAVAQAATGAAGGGAADAAGQAVRQTLGMTAGEGAGGLAQLAASAGASPLLGGGNVAMVDQVMRGLPPGHELASLVGNAALIYNQPFEKVAMLHILDRAASTGQLPMFLGTATQPGLIAQVGQALSGAAQGAAHLV